MPDKQTLANAHRVGRGGRTARVAIAEACNDSKSISLSSRAALLGIAFIWMVGENMSDLKSHHITWRTLMPRIVTLVIAVLAIPATASNVDAAYCGQASELSAARLRWAATRQTYVDPGQADKICRAYGQQFYEAVEARQAASVCQDSVNRQRDVDILDAEIAAFNNLIAAQCSGS
jgi:hypothetical protein